MICDVQRVRKWLCQATVSGHRNARRREAVWRQFVAVQTWSARILMHRLPLPHRRRFQRLLARLVISSAGRLKQATSKCVPRVTRASSAQNLFPLLAIAGQT